MKNPSTIIFTTLLRPLDMLDEDDDPCKGCFFEKEHSRVCYAAGAEAKRRGLEDCESGFIYIAVAVDPRQQDLFEAPEAAPESSGDKKEK